MTYTFKLSRRLAQCWAATVVIASPLAVSCGSDDGPYGPDSTPATANPQGIAISPQSVTLGVDQAVQFGVASDSTGSLAPGDSGTAPLALAWTATGGSVDASGKYIAGPVAGAYRVIARTVSGATDTATVTITAVGPTLDRIRLSPANASLPAGGNKQFAAVGSSTDGATMPVTAIYSAGGGTVSSAGLYHAGTVPGLYRVIVTDSASGKADTSAVTVTPAPITPPAPTLEAVVLTPATISLTLGGSQQFSATGHMSDGTTSPIAVTWTATGGTMASAGLYTAGQTAGSYRVIARETTGTLADTSTLTITAPTSPPAPPAPPAPPPAPGIPVFPGQSIQAAVNANGNGTSFLLKAGRHVRQSVVPKTGDVFRCEQGAVLDGENVTAYAFMRSGTDPDDVRIVSCVIERYAPPAQMGAILAGGHATSDGTSGWIVDSTEVRNNANLGIRLGNRMKVRWSNIHHNSQLGIGGVGDDILIEGNEIAYNNPNNVGNLDFEAGGTKFVLTNRLVLRNNFVHHNTGPGLWLDIDNDATLIENNRVEDNLREGIVTEISYSAVIRNNTVRRNGLQDPRRNAWPWGSGIGIHASRDVEIYGNVLEGNAHGIALIQQARGSGRLGAHVVQNITAHDNTVTLGSGSLSGAAAVTDIGDNLIFTGRNNRFMSNSYVLGGVTRPFAWMNAWRTQTEWTSYAQDPASSFIH